MPVDKTAPPDEVAYQRAVVPLAPTDAARFTVPGPQVVPPLAIGAVGTVFIVAVTGVLLLSQLPIVVVT